MIVDRGSDPPLLTETEGRQGCHPSSHPSSHPPSHASVGENSRRNDAGSIAKCFGIKRPEVIQRNLLDSGAPCWSHRNDHPRQTQKPFAKVPSDRCGETFAEVYAEIKQDNKSRPQKKGPGEWWSFPRAPPFPRTSPIYSIKIFPKLKCEDCPFSRPA